jgi:hypothetical protein
MPRCQMHRDLDRYTADAEGHVQRGGLSVRHPLVVQAIRRVQAALRLIRARGHSIGYDCPDETPDEAADRESGEPA